MSPSCFPPTVLLPDASLPSPGSSLGRVPRLLRYYRDVTTSCRPSRRTSFSFVLMVPRSHSSFRSHAWPSAAPRGPGVGHPVPPAGNCRGDGRISHVPGEPRLCFCPALRPRRTDRIRPLRCDGAAPILTTRRATAMNFRGSITRLWHWLSTLRRMGRPNTTQDSLPAAGLALPDGLEYPQGSNERFRGVSYISASFPKLSWRKVSLRLQNVCRFTLRWHSQVDIMVGPVAHV